MRHLLNRQSGSSLLELVVAMAIYSIIIMATIFAVTSALKITSDTQKQTDNLISNLGLSSLLTLDLPNAQLPLRQAYPNQIEWTSVKDGQRTYYMMWRAGCEIPSSPDNPRILLATKTSRVNLAANPSFEASFSNWTAAGTLAPRPTAFTQVADSAAPAGEKILRIEHPTTSGTLQAKSDPIATTPGQRFTVGGSYRATSGATGVKISYEWVDESGISVGTGGAATAITNTETDWSYYTTVTSPAPNDATGLVVILDSGAQSGGTASIASFDSILITPGTSNTSYFDGETNNGIWTGVPHASTSQQGLGFATDFPGTFATPPAAPTENVRTLARLTGCNGDLISYYDKDNAVLPSSDYEGRLRNIANLKLHLPTIVNPDGEYSLYLESMRLSTAIDIVNNDFEDFPSSPPVNENVPTGWTMTGRPNGPKTSPTYAPTGSVEKVTVTPKSGSNAVVLKVTCPTSPSGNCSSTAPTRLFDFKISQYVKSQGEPITVWYRHSGIATTISTCKFTYGASSVTGTLTDNQWHQLSIAAPVGGASIFPIELELDSINKTLLAGQTVGCEFDYIPEGGVPHE